MDHRDFGPLSSLFSSSSLAFFARESQENVCIAQRPPNGDIKSRAEKGEQVDVVALLLLLLHQPEQGGEWRWKESEKRAQKHEERGRKSRDDGIEVILEILRFWKEQCYSDTFWLEHRAPAR